MGVSKDSGAVFLTDQETAVDLLYHEAIAKTLVSLVRQSGPAPVTVGVHGDWGAGKSSILKMAESGFAEDETVLSLWFNGWVFEGFEDAKTVVLETIVHELRRARPGSKKVAEVAGRLLKRIDWLKVAKKAGGLAFTAFSGIPTPEQVSGLFDMAKSILEKPQDHISKDDVRNIFERAGDFIQEGKEEPDHIPEHIHQFRKEFGELLDAAELDQLVVIVDDLDRCLPRTAIATLEAIRLFLFVPRTAFVIGADELMIEYAVREHFPDLPAGVGLVPYARNYLEKLVQIPFRIPALGMAETNIYVTLLISELALGSKDIRFEKLLGLAREALRRPWINRGLDRAAIKGALGGELPDQVDQALIMSAQVSQTLTDGTRGNPRQIKRFLNSLMLRHAIAEHRGFATEMQRPVLAKVMLAERFSPEFYEQLARLVASAPNGMPVALAAFEAKLKSSTAEENEGEKKPPRTRLAVPPEVDEWSQSEWACRWAAVSPPLADIDLRPYVFVTRDKRSYLGGLAPASRLEGLVDRLLGAKLMARGAGHDVEKLTGSEPEEVFDTVRSRILQVDSFDTEPAGVAGLILLVEKHPSLQKKLLAFVQELPVERVGAWAATSWSTCLVDSSMRAEHDKQLDKWAKQTGNKLLSAAAKGALALRRR